MKLGVMLEVDETFMTIWLQGHPRSGSRWGDDLSPLSGLFFVTYFHFDDTVCMWHAGLWCKCGADADGNAAVNCSRRPTEVSCIGTIASWAGLIVSAGALDLFSAVTPTCLVPTASHRCGCRWCPRSHCQMYATAVIITNTSWQFGVCTTLCWAQLVLGWVSDRLQAGIPPRYVTKPSRSTQPYIHPWSLNWVPAFIGCGKGRNVTSAMWQITLCDPVWHVSSHSGRHVVDC